jgi:uncharacterized membrane protein
MDIWIQCVGVGAIWGFTNALMKRVDDTYSKNNGLLRNWRWFLAFGFNQFGSLLFYMTLQDADLSLVVPICQVTTLACTTCTAWLLGEKFEGDATCR